MSQLFTPEQEQGLESRSLQVVQLEVVERILFTEQSLHPNLNLRTAREIVIRVIDHLKIQSCQDPNS